MAYEFDHVVRAGDTDHTGYIYTPAVVEWVVIGVQDIRTEAGYSFDQYEEMGIGAVAVNVNVDYLAPIRIDDTVHIRMSPEIGHTSMSFDVKGAVDGTPVFKASIVLAFIDSETRESVQIPEAVKTAFEQFID